MAISVEDQLAELRAQLAEERESRAAAERAAAERADAQRVQHEQTMKMLAQMMAQQGVEDKTSPDGEAHEASAASGEVEDPASPTSRVGPVNPSVPMEVGPREDQSIGSAQSGLDGDYGLQGEPAVTHGSRRSFRAPMKMNPPQLRDRKQFHIFQQKVHTYAKFQDFDSVLYAESHLDVGDQLKSKSDFLREGVPELVYERHLRAWFFLSQAFHLTIDVGRFQRSKSPGKCWEETVKYYCPKSTGDQISLRKTLSDFKVEKGVDPIPRLYNLEEHVMKMHTAGIDVDEQTTLCTFVAGLPVSEYDFEIRQLSRRLSFDRDEVIHTIESQYNLLRSRRQKNSAAHALVVDGRGGGGGRGHPGGKRGGRGGGRGGKHAEKKKSGDGNGAEDNKPAAKGPQCYKCGLRGHFARDCTTQLCKRCNGRGHDEDKCPSSTDMHANMVIELPEPPESDSDSGSTTSSCVASGFMAVELDHAGCGYQPGKCDDGGPIGGVGELALQAGVKSERWHFDTGASGIFTRSSEKMTNFRPCNKQLSVAGGGKLLRIKGLGDLTLEFPSGDGQPAMRMEFKEVGFSPELDFNLISVSKAVKHRYKFSIDDPGLTIHQKDTGQEILLPPYGDMYVGHGRRVDGNEIACAVLTPGRMPTTDVDINHYHRTTSHTHPRLLRKSAEQQGVKLKPGVKLLPCVGCSAAKGYSAPVPKSTNSRSDKKNGRVFVDSTGKKPVASIGGSLYGIIFRDDATRMSREYFMKSKSEAPARLLQYIADTSQDGLIGIIRSDDAPELMYGEFAEICNKNGIKREFTSANTPQLNGVAERGLALIEKLAKTSMIQAKSSFVGQDLPSTERLWAEAHHFACDNLNRTATTSNKDMKSPYEMWHGKPPSPTLVQWLQPCFFKTKRKHKCDPQAEPGFYLGPADNHPRGTCRILSKATNQIHLTRDVTWHHVPTPAPLPAYQQAPPTPVEGRGHDDETAVGGREGTPLQGGGGDDDASDSDDDLSVEWEDETHDAKDVNVAAGRAPETTEPTGTPFQGTTPSAAVSHGGSFGDDGGTTPSSSNQRRSRSRRGGSSSSSSSSSSNTNTNNSSRGSGHGDGGSADGGGGGTAGDSAGDINLAGYAPLPPELPKGEAGRLQSWGRHGDLITSSRLRSVRNRLQEVPKEPNTGGNTALLVYMKALVTDFINGELEAEEMQEAEEFINGHACDDLLDSLATSATGFDDHESASNVFSLMHDTAIDEPEIALVTMESGKSESEIEMPSGPLSEAEVPPISVAGVYKSKYKDAYLWAMDKEMDGIVKNGTFTVLPGLPEGEKAVDGRWVLSLKSDENGYITTPKARLVAKGFMQREGVNYLQTYAPTPATTSVKIVLVWGNHKGYTTSHFDVKQAFTQAPLDYKVIMKLPGGCGDLSGKYVELKKALYGLKQSGALWNNLLVTKLAKHGMEQCKADPCVFRKIVKGEVILVLAVHVDDMAVAGPRDEVDKLLVTLNEDFTTVDLGELTFFTGCAVIQDVKDGITKINQRTFIETLARRFDVTTTARYPATAGADLGPRKEGEPSGNWPYKEAIGSLLWLVVWSRMEIANATRVVARHANNPTERHWTAVLQIIRYLLGTKDLSLTFEREPESDFELSVYTDSNFAEKDDDRRSVSGVAVCLGYSMITGFSSTHKTTSLSTAEAEYRALGDGVKEGLFAKSVASFVAPSLVEKTIMVYVDNEGAINLAINPFSSARTKHLDVRFHFVRELVSSGTITVEHVPTAEQRADLFTKALVGPIFREHRDYLMNSYI